MVARNEPGTFAPAPRPVRLAPSPPQPELRRRWRFERGEFGSPWRRGLLVEPPGRGWSLVLFRPYLEPRDLWVGLYHEPVHYGRGYRWARNFYLCPLPCLVLKVHVVRAECGGHVRALPPRRAGAAR